MARREEFKEGRTPLHTYRANIDYALKEALTVYGKIGVKVWICKGEILGKPDLSPHAGVQERGGKGGERGERRGGGRRGGGRNQRRR